VSDQGLGAAAPATTQDQLLGGRVRLTQPARGLRAGLDAVMLAASIPARPGERVLEAGCGSGAAFLCLLARVPDIEVIAIERDPALAALARQNAAAAGHAARVTVITGDIADPALHRALPRCAHAFANPPYWPGGSAPPEAARAGMTHERGATLADWAACLAAPLPRLGSVTLVLPAARWDAGAAALREAGCGALALLPLAPREGAPAKRVLLAGRRGGRGPALLLPPLVLHEGAGFSAAADSVLRDAAALPLTAPSPPDGAAAKAAHAPPPGSPCSSADSHPPPSGGA
jgi:tRNA1Val (adenine37-N6)-methyltransferase